MGGVYVGEYTTVVYKKGNEIVHRSFKNHFKAWKFAKNLASKGRVIVDAY